MEDVSRAEKEGKMVCGALSALVAYHIKREGSRACTSKEDPSGTNASFTPILILSDQFREILSIYKF